MVKLLCQQKNAIFYFTAEAYDEAESQTLPLFGQGTEIQSNTGEKKWLEF